jgi:hypothetical protein
VSEPERQLLVIDAQALASAVRAEADSWEAWPETQVGMRKAADLVGSVVFTAGREVRGAELDDDAWDRLLEEAQIRAWGRARATSLPRHECDRIVALAVTSLRESLNAWTRPLPE